MNDLLKKILGKKEPKPLLKDKIIYLILSDRKNIYKR